MYPDTKQSPHTMHLTTHDNFFKKIKEREVKSTVCVHF